MEQGGTAGNIGGTDEEDGKLVTEIPEYKPPTNFVPSLIILISGKRKCGKDYLASILQHRIESLNVTVGILRMANPIKYYWAKKHGLVYEDMLGSGSYKELHRLEMANWSVEHRTRTIGYFCHEAILMDNVIGKDIWICADMRHSQDLKWFYKYFPNIVKKIRINSNEEIRKERGWIRRKEIDDGSTECELDQITNWDLILENNEMNSSTLEEGIAQIINWAKNAILKK